MSQADSGWPSQISSPAGRPYFPAQTVHLKIRRYAARTNLLASSRANLPAAFVSLLPPRNSGVSTPSRRMATKWPQRESEVELEFEGGAVVVVVQLGGKAPFVVHQCP